MNALSPESFKRRSFVYRRLQQRGAEFGEVQGAAVALSFGNSSTEQRQAASLGLCDLSPLPRTGFKGPGTPDWLAGQGVVVPAASNLAARQPEGSVALRLAPNELFIIGDVHGRGTLVETLDRDWPQTGTPPATPRGFPVPRADSHAWFCLTGTHASATFAKICGVDLRPATFADCTIAQTSLARLSAIIARVDIGAVTAFHVLADSASAEYLWDCLLDAMDEFGGRPVGLVALRAL